MLPLQGAPPGPANLLAAVSLALGILGSVLALGSLPAALVMCCALPFLGIGLALGIGAAVCGHIALGQIRRSGGGQQGRGLAVAGLATGYAAVALAVIIAVLSVVALGLFGLAAAAGGLGEVQ
ncbi:MAG: DUF4190 domain-containing protein [Acidobacteria bacterium]|nr:DUF4190 domain-containing protein [Planctomycetota bacterium]MBE3134409.1 DUF4190 domain-containing protein [Acidobacteriota bacterium]